MGLHRYIWHNGEIKDAGRPSLFAGQLGLLSGWGVFSTVRAVDGALFAWERHWARMSRDAQLLNVEIPGDAAQLEIDLCGLLETNRTPNCTVRVVVVRNGGGMWEGPSSGRASDMIALTADSKRWGTSVRLGVQPNARYAASDFTRAKVLSWAANLRWAERAIEQGFDEVILLNEFGRATECTSANIFAAFGSEVVTPPTSEGCLPGITREVVVQDLRVPGIRVLERALSLEDLRAADELFITSTTRGLLPVREIPGRVFERQTLKGIAGSDNPVCAQLLSAFDAFVARDISARKAAVSGRLQKA
jgi:branched-chain amino acid aminotransferase